MQGKLLEITTLRERTRQLERGTTPQSEGLEFETTLVGKFRRQFNKSQRAAIAERLLGFVTTPQFKNRIEEIVQTSSDLQSMVEEEARSHYRVWRKRLQLYKTIEWDGSIV